MTDLLVSLLAAKTDAQAETNNSPKNAPSFFHVFLHSTMIQEKAWYKLSGAQVASGRV
ncbi:hypothetical protein HTZ85_23205 [Escherichia coli]|nr:hypothetical protein [Escherichia coli]